MDIMTYMYYKMIIIIILVNISSPHVVMYYSSLYLFPVSSTETVALSMFFRGAL